MTPVQHPREMFLFSLEESFHPAVGEISHPPPQAEAGGVLTGGGPKEDPLDSPGDKYVQSSSHHDGASVSPPEGEMKVGDQRSQKIGEMCGPGARQNILTGKRGVVTL